MSFEAEVIPLFIGDRGQRDRVFPGLAESAARKRSPGLFAGQWLPCCWDFSS